ncbi:MAG: hypothetical protein JRN21_09345 [Nitrososphaerota archaeon]|nr:hypothetical protein [Nitrososphaerota archaeon]
MEISSKLSVDDLVRLYAEAAVNDVIDPSDKTFDRRVELHNALCKALGVESDNFKPLEFTDGYTLDFKMAERMVRLEIQRLKRKTS